MHALHRPHWRSTAMITAIAAVLAIVLTLLVVTAIGDQQGSPPRLSTPSFSVPTAQNQAAAPVWGDKPFAPVFRSPIVAPWTQHPPFVAG